jgi:hypothetical protein
MITKINEFAKEIFNIGSISKKIVVNMDVEHTYHSLDRIKRDAEQKDVVSNPEILDALDAASYDIIEALLSNKIQFGGRVLITKTFNFLNIVCDIRIKNDTILLDVVTVMRKKDFINKNNTFQIII